MRVQDAFFLVEQRQNQQNKNKIKSLFFIAFQI